MNKRYSYILLAFLVTSCNSYIKKTITEKDFKHTCAGSNLEVKIAGIEIIDSTEIVVEVAFLNNCYDTLRIMNSYTSVDFHFKDASIYRDVVVNTMPIYPQIDWESTSKGFKQIYLEDKCRALVDRYDVSYIAPNETARRKYNLKALHFVGFKKINKYQFYVSVNAAERIKYFCPFLWTGEVNSKEYELSIK